MDRNVLKRHRPHKETIVSIDNSLGASNKVANMKRRRQEDEAEDQNSSEEEEESEQSSIAATSAFSQHFSHRLSTEEIETLQQRKWKFKWEVTFPKCTWKATKPDFIHAQSDATYGLKPNLFKHWLQLYHQDLDSSTRRTFFSVCNSYMDILHSNKRTQDSSHMDAYLMHSLNHIFRSRDIVRKNDRKFPKLSAAEIDSSHDVFRDRGFTRPKVLILLPLRSIAFRVVNRLIQLTPQAQRVNVEYHARFNDEFGCDEESNDNDGRPTKPPDWEALFGEGRNNDDDFKLGIKHTRKSIRLYADFYSSDMIIASPLGLVRAIGEAEESKNRTLDYLSSIEVLVIDHADVMSMQNWAHVITVIKKLNETPSEHDTDIRRIRMLFHEGHAEFYRQSIILSSYLTPEINSLFNKHCLNYKGKMRLECEYKGVLPKVVHSVTQIYERFDVDSMGKVDAARLECFTKKIFPKIKDSVEGGVMIFLNSHAELFMLRSFLKSQKTSFCIVNEFVSDEVKSTARRQFKEETSKIMIYTERAYFFSRYTISGVKKLIMYSLPDQDEFYPQIVNMLEESCYMESTALFSRFDKFKLERIVGHAHAKTMISSEKKTHYFR